MVVFVWVCDESLSCNRLVRYFINLGVSGSRTGRWWVFERMSIVWVGVESLG